MFEKLSKLDITYILLFVGSLVFLYAAIAVSS
ncbi:hypothetical protein JOC33_001544 [Thalassobacillus pellis]|nr:hypothetical protein [Thalassobacillus pellis]